MGLISDIPIVLAPRGEFSAGALKLKAFKKHFYLVLAHATGLYRPVTFWQASSPYEQIDIRRVMGKSVRIHVAPDLSPSVNSNFGGQPEKPIKQPGQVRIAFLSRITPKKNLHQAIQMLAPLAGQVTFDVYGIIRDESYWAECQKAITRMPDYIHVTYQGAIPNTDVITKLSHYHFFLLPTLGENFGHAILEALIAGCPVLISDQTPWRNLESQRVGWDIPLSNMERWLATLQHCIDMDNESYQIMTQAAWRFAQMHLQDPVARQQNIDLFMRAG
jgi:glycosyltransferase involved in cell wall biosynthesis